MRSTSRFFPLLAGLVAAASLAFAACGGDDGYGGSTSSTSPAATSPTPATAVKVVATNDTSKGKVLTDGVGLTLYTFKPDTSTPGKSSCTGSCATTWPPLTTTLSTVSDRPDGATGTFSTITRDDGAKQVAYNGSPLYRYSGDKKAGDTNGNGIGGVWFVALASQATGSTNSASPAASSPAAANPSPTAAAQPTATRPPQPTPTTAPAQPTPTSDPYGGGNYGY